MKKLLTLILILCTVLSLAVPVSAGDYWFEKDVNATDLTNAVIDYFNANGARNITDIELSNHRMRMYDVHQTADSIEFKIGCSNSYCFFFPPITFIPLPAVYSFRGVVHIDAPTRGMERPFELQIMPDDKTYTARGQNWYMTVVDYGHTRFKA